MKYKVRIGIWYGSKLTDGADEYVEPYGERSMRGAMRKARQIINIDKRNARKYHQKPAVYAIYLIPRGE